LLISLKILCNNGLSDKKEDDEEYFFHEFSKIYEFKSTKYLRIKNGTPITQMLRNADF
jgi:hypothetical protein